jgi:hypothetical protein
MLQAVMAGFGARLIVFLWMALALLGCNVDDYRNVCGFTFAGEIGPRFRPPMAACGSLSAKDYDDMQSRMKRSPPSATSSLVTTATPISGMVSGR